MNKIYNHVNDIQECKMLSVQINLLNKCTSKCVYCKKYTWPDDILDLKVLKKCIHYLKGRGVQSIVFSGGDPILYPFIEDILSYCKGLNIQTSLITTLISTNKELLEFIAKNCTRIHCSIDSSNVDTYKKLRGVDAINLVKDNIKFVNTVRKLYNEIPIRISSTISNKNYGEIEDLFNFAKDTYSTINYYFIHEHVDYFMNDEEQHKFINNIERIANIDCENISNAKSILETSFTKDISKVKSKYCKIPYIHCLINANGDIYPCCKLLNDNGCYGEQLKYVYGNIYNEDLDFEFSKRFSNYNICEYCNGCEERYTSIIDSVNDIIDNKCKLRLFL